MVRGPLGGKGGVARAGNRRATESKLSRGGKMAYDVCRTGLGDEMRRGRGGNLSRGVARAASPGKQRVESTEEKEERGARIKFLEKRCALGRGSITRRWDRRPSPG